MCISFPTAGQATQSCYISENIYIPADFKIGESKQRTPVTTMELVKSGAIRPALIAPEMQKTNSMVYGSKKAATNQLKDGPGIQERNAC